MNIAVIGAGYSGLASVWEILTLAPLGSKITLFDAKGIGGGASGVAAGLLHCFAGMRATLNPHGREGLEAAKNLLGLSSQTLGKEVASRKGILRAAETTGQVQDFSRAAGLYSDVLLFTPEKTQYTIPGLPPYPAIFIESGITVYSEKYLQGLWLACKNKGAVFMQRKISSLQELKGFDKLLFTTGAFSLEMKELSSLPITPVKGQLLQLEWPQELPPLPFALSSQVYLIMAEDGKSCIAGSTFERNFQTLSADLSQAKEEILPKVKALFPPLDGAKVLDCRASIRASSKTRLPLVQKISENGWVLTGMGSKGLLYHALFARQAAAALFSQ